MKILQKNLRKNLTREESIEKFYSKSKSSGLKNVIMSVLKNFDSFCFDVYGKDSESLLEELREDIGDSFSYLWLVILKSFKKCLPFQDKIIYPVS